MLNYKFKVTQNSNFIEIPYDNLFFDKNCQYISGYTSTNNNLVDGQDILLTINNSQGKEYKINLNNVIRQGYCIYSKKIILEDNVFIDSNSNEKILKGCWYIDGKYYYENYTTNYDTTHTITLPTAYGLQSISTFKKNEIIVQSKYWIDNSKVIIDDIEYDINIDNLSSDKVNQLYLGKKYVEITLFKEKEWLKISNFIIHKNDDYLIKLDNALTAKKRYYVTYGKLNNNDQIFYFEYDENLNEYITNINDKIFILKGNIAYNKDNVNEILEVKYEWVNDNGNYLHLYTDNLSYKFVPSQIIYALEKNANYYQYDMLTDNNKNYFIINGKKYYQIENDTIDVINYNNEIHEITYTDNLWGLNTEYAENEPVLERKNTRYGYFKIKNDIFLLLINTEFNTAMFQNDVYYIGDKDKNKTLNVKKYNYIIYENEKIPILTYQKSVFDYDIDNYIMKNINYVELYHSQKFTLVIDEVINNNILICRNSLDNNLQNLSNLINNLSNFNFYLENSLFDKSLVEKEYFLFSNIEGNDFNFILYNPLNTLNIPLIISNNDVININKEDIIENSFIPTETDKVINPIVDMERDMYYPTFRENNNELSDINEIRFYLHFRTRNLSDWTINDNKSVDTNKTNWNIFDYYDNNKITNIDSKFYQPSDLLYFLGFDVNDVYYQKEKIKKSFLRILFYDTNDIATQSLLYMSTIFLDSENLFNTYTKNRIVEGAYIDIDPIYPEIANYVYKYINVRYEPCDNTKGNNPYTFDETKRLSCQLSVKDMHSSEKSSEGFYLYLFKDFSSDIVERSIYMKFEFNHAGKGKTINLSVPYKEINGEKEMISLYNQSVDLDDFKKGYPLQEYYQRLFIEIKIRYDKKKKRFSYYLPNWLTEFNEDKNIMKFNLYEIKINDETNI